MGDTVYRNVNDLFPSAWKLPPLPRKLAGTVASRIFRHFGGIKHGAPIQKRAAIFDGRVRRCWIDNKGVSHLSKGWRRLIHDTSHRIFSRRYPDRRPHDPLHANLEYEVAEWVIKEFIGKLPVTAALNALVSVLAPTKAEKRKEAGARLRRHRYSKIMASIKKWEAQQRKAAAKLKGLYRKQKYYEHAGVSL